MEWMHAACPPDHEERERPSISRHRIGTYSHVSRSVAYLIEGHDFATARSFRYRKPTPTRATPSEQLDLADDHAVIDDRELTCREPGRSDPAHPDRNGADRHRAQFAEQGEHRIHLLVQHEDHVAGDGQAHRPLDRGPVADHPDRVQGRSPAASS